MSDPTVANIKAFLAAAGALVALGIGWAELNARIDRKAEEVRVDSVRVELQRHLRDSEQTWRVNRILLCRIPQVRPDSHCEGFR